jgi:hypothetical protein
MIEIVNGDKGWQKIDGQPARDLDAQARTAATEVGHLFWIAQLTGLQDRTNELSPLGEIKVGERPAVGIKVKAKGREEVNVFFDRETGLLVKTERQTTNPFFPNKMINEERIISDYQNLDGRKVPKRVLLYADGQKFAEAEISAFRLLEKHDPNLFTKP